MSLARKPICTDCWMGTQGRATEDGAYELRVPYRVKVDDPWNPEQCWFCQRYTSAGIYIMLDPEVSAMDGAKLAEDEPPWKGHTFRFTMVSRGVTRVHGEPAETTKDADWWGSPITFEVRAWSLVDALKKAALVPFPDLMRDMVALEEDPQDLDWTPTEKAPED